MATVASEEQRQRIGELRVECPKCGARCRAMKSFPSVTYYSCPNGCKQDKAIKIRRPQQ